ncbi:Protein of unknown function [Lactobacillus delbrueckii subsp. lactis]|nr:Protein of unknown function [Lactobacillus delbrueckii subsp. lactis]
MKQVQLKRRQTQTQPARRRKQPRRLMMKLKQLWLTKKAR